YSHLSCLHLSGAPLVAHSFPTRRSSDLSKRERGEDLRGVHGAAVREHEDRGKVAAGHDDGEQHHRRDDRAQERQRDPPDPPEGSDRKSTRLNSSHGSISYAVFCLKKKKK